MFKTIKYRLWLWIKWSKKRFNYYNYSFGFSSRLEFQCQLAISFFANISRHPCHHVWSNPCQYLAPYGLLKKYKLALLIPPFPLTYWMGKNLEPTPIQHSGSFWILKVPKMCLGNILGSSENFGDFSNLSMCQRLNAP